MLLGTATGVLMLEAFWATVLADLSPGYGPAISFGFGHALALMMVGAGVLIGRIMPPIETAGIAILAPFAATGLLWGLPETRTAGTRKNSGPTDMARALQATTRRSRQPREAESEPPSGRQVGSWILDTR